MACLLGIKMQSSWNSNSGINVYPPVYEEVLYTNQASFAVAYISHPNTILPYLYFHLVGRVAQSV